MMCTACRVEYALPDPSARGLCSNCLSFAEYVNSLVDAGDHQRTTSDDAGPPERGDGD
jgi:hypothetical protein